MIKKMTVYICDRCGQRYDPKFTPADQKVSDEFIDELTFVEHNCGRDGNSSRTKRGPINLCLSCSLQLERFMNNVGTYAE